MSNVSDEIIRTLREMSEGSSAAFHRFYDQYAPLVLHIALRMLGDRMEAEDICHDVFLEVLNKADRYDPTRGSIEAWLAVTTRSRCLDWLRRSHRVYTDPDPVPEAGLRTATERTIEERVVGKLQGEALREALRQLPLPQQQAVAGMYLQYRTQRELSDELKVPLGTIKSSVRYGLNNMRKHLIRLGWVESPEGRKPSD